MEGRIAIRAARVRGRGKVCTYAKTAASGAARTKRIRPEASRASQGTDPAATLRNVRHGSMKDRRRGASAGQRHFVIRWPNKFFNWTFDRIGLLDTKHLRHDLRQRSRFAEISCGRGRIDLLFGY